MIERIREIQKTRHLTSTAIAAAAGMDASYVRHILKGDNKMDYRVLIAILQLLPDVSPDYLLLGRGELSRTSTSYQDQFSDINRRLEAIELSLNSIHQTNSKIS